MGVALRHIGIVVSNLDRAIDIFTNYFGCSSVNNYPKVSGDYISKLVGIDNIGVSHFAMTVEDIGKLYQNRNAYDVRFLSEPLLSPNCHVQVAYAVVMEEFIVELVQVLDERGTSTN